jgi:hypothetical protein
MKVKIFSVRYLDKHGGKITKWDIIDKEGLYEKFKLKNKIVGDFSPDDLLEKMIQFFLDEHPEIRIKYVQYVTTPISFGEPGLARWVIEKSVLIFYDEQDE